MNANHWVQELRTILVDLYPTTADLRRVAHDAGVALDRVALDVSALNNWDALLREAQKNQQVADLLDVARQAYPGNDALRAAYRAYGAMPTPVTTPLPDENLHLLNFGRELTSEQCRQIETRLGERIHRLLNLPHHFVEERPFGPQCVALLDKTVGWSPAMWETTPILINPPGFAPVALALISVLHGHIGYFPAMIRLRPETTGMKTTFVLAEIINLQALRNGAREAG